METRRTCLKVALKGQWHKLLIGRSDSGFFPFFDITTYPWRPKSPRILEFGKKNSSFIHGLRNFWQRPENVLFFCIISRFYLSPKLKLTSDDAIVNICFLFSSEWRLPGRLHESAEVRPQYRRRRPVSHVPRHHTRQHGEGPRGLVGNQSPL